MNNKKHRGKCENRKTESSNGVKQIVGGLRNYQKKMSYSKK